MPNLLVEVLAPITPAPGGSIRVLVWQFGMPLGVAMAALLRRRSVKPERRGKIRAIDVATQAAMLFGGLTLYKGARSLVESEGSIAFRNAVRITRLEREIGLFIEPDLQNLALRSDLAVRLLNANYTYGFLPLLTATVTWLYLTDPPNYRLMRNCLGLSALAAVLTVALYPVAPPRLLPEAGLVDTIAAAGGHISFTNRYAAMPSLHVGWMVLGGYCLWRSVLCGFKVVVLMPGLVMAFTVVVTGNHFWLDAAVGALFCLVPAFVLGRGARQPT